MSVNTKTAKVARLRLQEKSKKVEDVIQRLENRLHAIESVHHAMREELQDRQQSLLAEVRAAIESYVQLKFSDALTSLQNVFDQQRSVFEHIIHSAKKVSSARTR